MRTRFTDHDVAPFEVRAIQGLSGLFGFLVAAHLDKTEAFGPAAEFVCDDACADYAAMLRGLVPTLERHHNVRILQDGMVAAVRLSHRYLPDRQLPDKAVSVLDTACARLSLGQNATPAAVEDARRTLTDLDVQQRVLQQR